MKKIILFRHGKSAWESGISDFERDLNPIGVKRTGKSAEYLFKNPHLKIDAWYSSPAKRAERTAEIAAGHFHEIPEIRLNRVLYTFSFFDLLKFVKKLDNSLQTIILFGHNEAFTEFVNRMGNQYLDNLPTSGVAILEFDISDWQKIDKGKTLSIIKPKSL
ncbi:MAG: histidine phosphatase family protein [Weeksellaceae bacterium]